MQIYLKRVKTAMIDKSAKYLIIGAGPAGIAGARNFQLQNVPFEGVEAYDDVGGLWNIKNPKSTIYESAHLISSKTMTEFKEFPMADSVADYPSHRDVLKYFQDYCDKFDLKKYFKFGVNVESIDKLKNGHWEVKTSDGEITIYKGVVIAVGTLSEPKKVSFEGDFTGEIIHSAVYKSAKIFEDKRVLVVGAGNSGCDIVVDAVHHAKCADISVRRGYHFVPKYIFGKPADTLGGKQTILPDFIKRKLNKAILKALVGNVTNFGFPKPDHDLFESHPIVNSLVLHHIGHGDINIQADIERLDGKTVYFKDGKSQDYDTIVLSTGYKVHYPFIDKKYLNWESEASPNLHLNIFHPKDDSIFVLGMVEAVGIGWQGRWDMASLLATYIKQKDSKKESIKKFDEKRLENNCNLSGPFNYIKLDRMSYYLHKDTYLDAIHSQIKDFS